MTVDYSFYANALESYLLATNILVHISKTHEKIVLKLCSLTRIMIHVIWRAIFKNKNRATCSKYVLTCILHQLGLRLMLANVRVSVRIAIRLKIV